MGMSANQARLLTLTARQHDLELRAQRISSEKIALMYQSQAFATKFSNALAADTFGGLTMFGSGKTIIGYEEDTVYTKGSADYANYYLSRFNNIVVHSGDAFGNDDTAITTAELFNSNIDNLVKKVFNGSAPLPVEESEETETPDVTEIAADVIANLNPQDKLNFLHSLIANRHPEFANFGEIQFGDMDDIQILEQDGKYVITVSDLRCTANGWGDRNYLEEILYMEGRHTLEEIIAKEQTILGRDRSETYLAQALQLEGDETAEFTAEEIATVGSNYNAPAVQTAPVYRYETLSLEDQIVIKGAPIYGEPEIPAQTQDVPSIQDAKNEYDAAMANLSSIEKILDMELTQINTEHQAVKTEYDAVKSLISENVEKSFNVFG